MLLAWQLVNNWSDIVPSASYYTIARNQKAKCAKSKQNENTRKQVRDERDKSIVLGPQ